MTRNNPHVKAYLFILLYGGSKAKARAAVVESFQPFAKTKRRQIGRAIRTAERIINSFRSVKLPYRSFAEQKALYEKWKAAGRGVVAVPQTDLQRGSHHSRGFAIDMAAIRSESKHRFDVTLMAYTHTLPVQQPCTIVHIGSGA